MALGDPAKSLRIEGRLVANPTNLAIAFPHGGLELGLVAAYEFDTGEPPDDPTEAEEFTGEEVEYHTVGGNPVFFAFLVGLNNNMVTTLFRSTTTGGSGDPIVANPGTHRTGTRGSDRAIKLVFSPRLPSDHTAIIIYRAVPMIVEGARLQMGINRDMGIAVMFRGLRDATGRKSQGPVKLSDITL